MERADRGLHAPSPAGRALCLLAAYFAAHVAIRTLLPDSLELDEAEQLVLAQTLDWGYGTKPPLYSWLQIGFFRLFGEGVAALSLLKNLLLFGTYLCTFLAARQMTGRTESALAAALSLLLIPQIAWESQRDLTHSVLAIAVAALTLYLFARLCAERSTWLYLVFGTVVGLGLLAKFNYLIFPAALAAAALTLPALRPVILDRRSVLSLAAALAVAGGYLFWFATNTDAALAQTGTFHMKKAIPYWQSLVKGAGSLVKSTLAFNGVAFATLLLVFRHPGNAAGEDRQAKIPYAQLLGRAILVTLLILAAMVILFRVTYFKDRWLLPVLFYAPTWLVLRLSDRVGRAGLRRLAAVCAAIALLVLVLIPSRVVLAGRRDAFDAINLPVSGFAAQMRQSGHAPATIVAENGLLAGNLRLHFPESSVIAPELPLPDHPARGECLLAWEATEAPQPPLRFTERARKLGFRVTGAAAEFFSAPYHYAGTAAATARLGILRCEPTGGGEAAED